MALRFGILGCARIAPIALIRPARRLPEVEVVAVGSRSPAKARRWARRHGVARAYGSYDDVLGDPQVDAVYVPLPNALHAGWAIRALQAGKHVLCEKPVAASEREAQALAETARNAGRVGMEAFHYRYHPLFQRMTAIVGAGDLGELRRVEASLSVPLIVPGDIRWDPELAGGATMDVGSYVVNAARALVGAEAEVLTAAGSLTRRGVDRSMQATLAFPRGVEADVRASLLGIPNGRIDVIGTRGRMSVFNPFMPQLYYRLRVKVDNAERRETVADGTTYMHQLSAFTAAVLHGAPVATSFDDAIGGTRVLDQIRGIIGVRPSASGTSKLRRAS